MASEKPSITRSPAWQALLAHKATIANSSIGEMFAAQPQRFETFSLRLDELLLDYSKNLISSETIRRLAALARERGVGESMHRMFSGQKINTTENRPVLHTALRGGRSVTVDGVDTLPQAVSVREQMRNFSDGVRTGRIAGSGGGHYTDVINIGIGGSHLGPMLAVHALAPYADPTLHMHFASNIDGAALYRLLAPLSPATTLVNVVSKTFTTMETMTNARSVRRWLANSLGEDNAARHFVAVTANVPKATEFGVDAERVFPFWDWVGGRYSLWSAVGLPVALAIGMQRFEKMLAGAAAMDDHFRNAPFEKSMPVILAMLGIWYNNFFGAATHAILPYDDTLALLPAYLQQLDMESSGKRVTHDGAAVDYDTGQVIWGAPGTDAQHSFFQLLHQGTRLIPADFIAACRPHHVIDRHHEILMANFFAQTTALMNGDAATSAHDVFPGNRPTNSILVEKLTPHALGMLLALYEHKVFVQNAIWDTNAFDQPGVELGKRLATRILPELERSDPVTAYDASTNGLINFYKSNCDSRSSNN
jgi:glucose-6-phosphate isomerase